MRAALAAASLGLAALLGWLLAEAGGLAEITRAVAAHRPEAARVPQRTVCINWFSTIALMGLASVLYPQAIQRIFAAESAQALKRSFSGMTFMPLATTLVVTLIGVAAIARFDIAHAVVWLAGPETDMMTGQVVSPNAGEFIVGY